jgi:hypothetical protein
VAKTKEVRSGIAHYVQRLHALDVTTGADRVPPALLGDSQNNDAVNNNLTPIVVHGASGPGTFGGDLPFNAFRQLQRSAAALAPPDSLHPRGVVYLDFASHSDNGAYRGWVLGYDPGNLQLLQSFTTSVNFRGAGVWQSGAPVAIDAGNNLFFATGNAFGETTFSTANLTESVVRINTAVSGQLVYRDSFTPYNWQALDAVDQDLGSGGTLLLPDAVGSAPHPHLLVETGKAGRIYLLDRDNLGGLSPDQSTENVRIVDVLDHGVTGAWSSPAFLLTGPNTGLLYYHGAGDSLRAFQITNGHFVRGPGPGGSVSYSANSWGFPGAQVSTSSNGSGNGIVWELRSDAYNAGGPEVLYAYDAGNLQNQLYSSNGVGLRDVLGPAVKFVVPVITNGHVFAGTANGLAVFGLLPTSSTVPATVSDLAATADSPSQITLTWTNPSSDANLIRVERSTDGGATFTPLQVLGGSATSYVDTGLQPATVYSYRIRGENNAGPAGYSNVASARTQVPAPTLVALNVLPRQVDLAWNDDPTYDDHFELARSSDGVTFATIATLPPTQHTYSDTASLNPGATYYYVLRAFHSGGGMGASLPLSATLPCDNVPFPIAPTGLTGTAPTGIEVDLQWTNLDTYYVIAVQRSLNSQIWCSVATFSPYLTVQSHHDTNNISPVTHYFYRLAVTDECNQTSYSNVFDVTTPCQTVICDEIRTEMGITIIWCDPCPSENNLYKIELSNDGGQTYQVIAMLPGKVTSFTITGLEPGDYLVRVRAIRPMGEEDVSAPFAFTIGPPG